MPSNPSTAKAWLRRARGNLVRAKLYGGVEGTFYEDSCFDAQQAAEKAIKALLVHLLIPFQKTHSIVELLTEVEEAGVTVAHRVAPRATTACTLPRTLWS